jgi:hypothetical protein
MDEKEPSMERQNQEYAAGPAIAEFIRRRSEAGQLVTAEEICQEFLRMGMPTEKENEFAEFEDRLKDTIQQNEELKEITDGKGVVHYYSLRSMAETYARILIGKGEDPLPLMAEIVRENSHRYPRPVPLMLFEELPFELRPAEISSCLNRMAARKDFQDIQQTTTSIGTVFLFSALYLEPDYAAFLAEWVDVGQANSP